MAPSAKCPLFIAIFFFHIALNAPYAICTSADGYEISLGKLHIALYIGGI
jgi:hypothetical protein